VTCLPPPGAAAEAEARKKIDEYSPRCQVQGDSFAPIVIEDGGRLGPHLTDLLFQISSSLTDDDGGKGFDVYWRQRLAARNLRGISACIFQQLPDPPSNSSEATGFQLTLQSPRQHRFADPPPRLTSSLSRRPNLGAPLPQWVNQACQGHLHGLPFLLHVPTLRGHASYTYHPRCFVAHCPWHP